MLRARPVHVEDSRGGPQRIAGRRAMGAPRARGACPLAGARNAPAPAPLPRVAHALLLRSFSSPSGWRAPASSSIFPGFSTTTVLCACVVSLRDITDIPASVFGQSWVSLPATLPSPTCLQFCRDGHMD